MDDHFAFNHPSFNYNSQMMRIFIIFLFGISLAYGDDDQYIREKCVKPQKCVQRNMCDNGFIVVDGRKAIQFRTIGNDGCESLSVCCSPNNTSVVPITSEPPSNTYNCKEGCGYSNKNGLDITLVNSTSEAQIGEFPWVVIIINSLNRKQIGGGSLIAPNVVLTKAKHIETLNPQRLIVRAGEWDKKTNREIHKHVDKRVSLIETHPQYNSDNGDYNAALLILKTSYRIVPNISPVCLAPATKTFDNLRCFVAGWGKKDYYDSDFMDIQKKIDVPIINRMQCQEQLRNSEVLGENFELQPSLMCAGGEKDKDACTGDGGAPLFCPMANQPDRFEQVGIVNWGINCNGENIPGVYTSVSHIRSWIDQKMVSHSVSLSYYIA